MSLKLPRHWDFSTFKPDTARLARSRSVIPEEGATAPGSPQSPTSNEKPLKAGWLKKQQRSLVKNWQQRYFVLRGSTLTYHKDDKETTVQGVIQLRSSKVHKLLPNPDDPAGKYLFEIVPRKAGSTGDRERCPYVFMANSHSDLEEWVRSLRRVIEAPTSAVFGMSLLDIVTREKRFGPPMVPILVQKCVEFIKERGLDEEGIFRLPGQDNAVKQFRDAFDAGERPSFPSDTDVHTVASLLKLYLRELPEPVVPWTQYQDFLDSTNLLDSSSKEGWKILEIQISLLPKINYNLLGYVCRFLFEVQQHAQVNKMNVENLATVMGINLLKPQIEDPITVMKATPQIQKLMTVMIRQHETLFPLCKEAPPPSNPTKADSQNNTPRSFVGWESAEIGDASLSESPEEEEENEGSNGGGCSHQPHLEAPSPSLDCPGGPRKRTQTLPTFSCPLSGMAAKAEALNRWSRIQESAEEKSGTFSEDIFKLLELKSSGSLFTRIPVSGKEDEVKRGREKMCLTLTDGSQAPSSPMARQKSLDNLTVNLVGQEVNNKMEEKIYNQQLTESLQRENEQLRATVAELQLALEVERRRVAALETSLKNADRTRDQAQRHIKEKQRDIPLSPTWEKHLPT